MVDAIAPAVFGDAHLVVGRHLVIAVAGLHESLATGLIKLDQPAAVPGAQHVWHHENGWMRDPQAGVALGDKRANGTEHGLRLCTRLALEDGMDVAVEPQHDGGRLIARARATGGKYLAVAGERHLDRRRRTASS